MCAVAPHRPHVSRGPLPQSRARQHDAIFALGAAANRMVRNANDNLAVYQALARFGTSVDLAMFNLGLNYSISMNSATTTSYRTGYHQVQFNLAYVF